MIGFGKVALSAGFLVAAAAAAYAADPQPAAPATTAAPQSAYYAAGTRHSNAQHFEPPMGYNQNRWLNPYKFGYGPKAN